MTLDDRIRSAIQARTSRVEPSPGALHDIQEKLMHAQQDNNRTRLMIGLGAAAAIIAVVAGVVVVTGDDDDQDLDVAGTTTTEEPTTSASTTSTTVFDAVVDPAVAIWPRVGTSQRFESPVAAAQSFATDFLGFTEPIVGELRQGDTRSGEVPVQPAPDGPETTVLVRQLEDDTWFVIAADTADITLDSPAAGDLVECPVQLTGEALAFEGHVDVAIRDDVSDQPLGAGFVTGGGGPAAPFDGTVECDLSSLDPGAQYGSIVMTTAGGEDGRVWTAEVIRVQLQPAS
ncbi:MAG TPA: Gmad2 immunoglobulin-like domain-containing protein [Acidimicrobiales bacterium]